jgi:hypothetical protein
VRPNRAFRPWQQTGARLGRDDLIETRDPGRFTRRPLLRAAVLGQRQVAGEHSAAYESLARPSPLLERTVVTGRVSDISPHVLVLRTREGEERLTLTPATTAWRGTTVAPTALRHGDWVIVRKAAPPSRGAARDGTRARTGWRTVVERMWAEIGRATGTIVEAKPVSQPSGSGSRRGMELLVDEGPGKGRKIVVISADAYQQILVRFPRLQPGYLLDVIGLRDQGFLRALTPATSQPPYRASHVPVPPLVSGHVPDPVSGTAVWHEPGEEPARLIGLAYPAVDPETGCEHALPDSHGIGPGCVRLPYLSLGSVITVRNDCTGMSAPLSVTSCGASARLFCDRCVECRTSPRGRIADLTMAAFVGLGGRLEKGCFNASISMTR